LLTKLHRRELSLVEVETPTASPFASSLLFDYVATYMYEGDTPNAERRAAALSLDRDLLRELLGQEELRELIDADALATVEDDLQHRSQRTQAANRDALHDVLRRLGDLNEDEVRARVLDGCDPDAMLADLERERRAIRVRVHGEPRWIVAQDAGLYRDALAVAPPGGLPDAFLEEVPDALERLLHRYAQTHGPFTTAEVRERYGADPTAALTALEAAGELVRGELRPGGSEREWCDPEVLRRLRRASLAVLRKEIEPADQRALARFQPSWQGVDRHPASGAGVDRLREVLVPLQGLALPAEAWERDVLPRRVGAYSPTWMDSLCASGEVVWIGAGAIGRRSGRVALYFRDDVPLLGPPPLRGEPPAEPAHDLVRERLRAGACFFTDLLADVELAPEALQEALWDLVWAGEVTNDAFAPLRAPRLTLARAQRERVRARSGRRFSSRRTSASAQVQGRWSLTAPLSARDAADPGARRRAQAELLLERYGIVTREQVLAEGMPGGFSSLYDSLAALETLGVCRRGYFVEGLGGAQFALPGAVERLRAGRDVSEEPPLVLSAVDPAQAYGAALPWPKRDGETRRPQRVAGAYVVLAGAEPVLYVERSGKSALTFIDPSDPRLRAAFEALAEQVRAGRVKRVALERIDGESILGSPYGELLVELGFRQSPRALTLSA
ncbi:MAG: ATP-dependent helicase Lhr and Lhr-like helicase, partial [Solirubrobacteraceae bacterium]|nr:ATP-dependent helicase Lhr and Lhr-like helicase [Solirubrobacteraceae bacterium]